MCEAVRPSEACPEHRRTVYAWQQYQHARARMASLPVHLDTPAVDAARDIYAAAVRDIAATPGGQAALTVREAALQGGARAAGDDVDVIAAVLHADPALEVERLRWCAEMDALLAG